MFTSGHRSLPLLSALLLTLAACGSGSDSSSKPAALDYLAQVATSGGAVATFHSGAPPAAGSGPTASASNSSAILPGGSALFTVSADGSFSTIYITIAGVDGYWQLDLSSAATGAIDLVLSVGQHAPSTFTLRFGVGTGGAAGAYDTVPVTLTEVGTGAVQVSLTWDAESDVDLHLVEPGGEEIYYGHERSAAGGTLDLDSNAACSIDGKKNENITYQGGTPPHGSYTVRVDYWDSCTVATTHYVVTTTVGGVTHTYNGTLTGGGDQGGSGDGVTVATFTY